VKFCNPAAPPCGNDFGRNKNGAAFIDLFLVLNTIPLWLVDSFQLCAFRFYLLHALDASQIFHSLALDLIIVRVVVDVILSLLCSVFNVIFDFLEIIRLLSDLLSHVVHILLFQLPGHLLLFFHQQLLLVVSIVLFKLDRLDGKRNSFVFLFNVSLLLLALSVFFEPDLFSICVGEINLYFLLVMAVSL